MENSVALTDNLIKARTGLVEDWTKTFLGFNESLK